jgi:adenylosuccinate synthase
MPNVVIVGTQWGDEGKGKIVDILSNQSDIVVRFQGGPNAGHTVVVGEKQTILHQVPSGILHDSKKCVIGNGVVIDLETFIDEVNEVKSQGYFTDDSALVLSENAHLIMPYHKRIDIAREKLKGKNKIGTTGRGIGPAYEDKVTRNGIRVVDIFNDDIFRQKLTTNLKEKNFYLEKYLNEEGFDVDDIFNKFTALRDRIKKYVTNTSLYLFNSLKENQKILFEGAQGTMLDVDHGTYPFVTSSNTAAAQASLGSGIGPKNLDTILGIAKAYTTRVGAGPFPTELDDETGKFLRDNGGEYGATTGRPRRCGWLDLAVIKYSAQINSTTHITLTKMDVLSGLKKIKVCTGYTYNGETLPGFPSDFSVLEKCVPIYDEVDGWDEDISSATKYEELPENARKYISYIEEKTNVPIIMVSVGTRRKQIITIKDPFST